MDAVGTVEFFDGTTRIGAPLPIAGDRPVLITAPLAAGSRTLIAVIVSSVNGGATYPVLP